MTKEPRSDRAKTVRRSGVVRVGLWIMAGVLVAALIGAGAASFVPPERLWWLQALCLALSPLAYTLAVIAVVAGWRRQWGLLVFCILPIGLLLALPMLTSERGMTPASGPAGATLKVISFNAKPEAIEQGEAGFSKLLEEEQPHLVALQEFPLRIFA